ncbi:hypothetical protein RhiJN_20690 [Ceratobasidium sp. AG-Ba]|nr:hypothetical protein RhiJN_20690 [Ceratobasidium sp. AG-Ba]
MAEQESVEQLLARLAAHGYMAVPTAQASLPVPLIAKAAPLTTNRMTTQVGLGTPSTAASNTVPRSFSASRVTPVVGAVPVSQSRPSIGRVPASRTVSASHVTANKDNNSAISNSTMPNGFIARADSTPSAIPAHKSASSGAPGAPTTIILPPAPPVSGSAPATTEPPTGEPPTYAASVLRDGILQRASGGLLSRTTPIVFAIVPKEPPGSPGRGGETGYRIWETLKIPKSVHLGIWGIVRAVYMHSPDIDTNLSFTNQRPKGIAEQVLIEQVLPLLPELAVYEPYGYWPLFKYGLGVLRSTSNLYQRQLAKLNPGLKSKKGKKSGGKGKEKGKGKTRSRAPVKSSKMEVDDKTDGDDKNRADDNDKGGNNSGDAAAAAMATEADLAADAGANNGDRIDAAGGDDELAYNMSSLHITGNNQELGKEADDDDDDKDLLMGDMLPPDLTGQKPSPPVSPIRSGYPKIFQQPLTPAAQAATQPVYLPVSQPTVEAAIDPTVAPGIKPAAKPAIEHAAEPALASRAERAGQLTTPVAIHNTATATASAMSTSSATATFATPSMPGSSPWGNPVTLSPIELLASLQQLPAEYLNTLPPQLAQLMRSMGLGSATVSAPDPPAPAPTSSDPPASAELDELMTSPKPKAKSKAKPQPRPVPPVETQTVNQEADENFGDSPLTPPSSILGGDEPVSYQEPNSRGRGGGKPGRGRGRGGAKKSAGRADGVSNSGDSQVSTQPTRLTRASGTTQFLDGLSVDDLDPPILGVLLEVVPGIALRSLDVSSVDLDSVVRNAIRIVDTYSKFDVLNEDVRLGNFILKPNGSVAMIDFAQSRLREDDESGEEWRNNKHMADEEGHIGYQAKLACDWPFTPIWKYSKSKWRAVGS